MLHIERKYLQLISARLRNFKQKSMSLYNFSCPYCGDSDKNKYKARGYAYQFKSQLNYKCHNCGKGTSFGNLLKHVDEEMYREYARERFLEGVGGKRGNHAHNEMKIDHEFKKPKGKPKREIDKLMERCDKLAPDHKAAQYLKNRQIPKKKWHLLYYLDNMKKLEVLDEKYKNRLREEDRLVIPFFNHKNKMYALTCRAFGESDRKYIELKLTDDMLVYGMERLDSSKPIYIVEGPIDSLFLPNCIAAGSASLDKFMKYLPKDKTVLVYDNQPRNPDLLNIIKKSVNHGYKVVLWPEDVNGKDINEMIENGYDQEKIMRIILDNTYQGLEAEIEFVKWRKM